MSMLDLLKSETEIYCLCRLPTTSFDEEEYDDLSGDLLRLEELERLPKEDL